MIGLAPGAFLYFNLKSIERRKVIGVGAAMFALPAVLALAVSKEAAIGISVIELAAIYYLENQEVKIKTDLAEDMAIELKEQWQFIPKRERVRVRLEKTAAWLVQKENGDFTVAQAYSVLQHAFGAQAEEMKEIIVPEIQEWANELPKHRDGKDTHYKFEIKEAKK